MKGYVCLLALLMIGATSSVGQSGSNTDEQSVLKTENAWLDAEQKRDIPALEAIIANDFVGSGPNGASINKEMITSIPADAKPFNKSKLTDLSAKVFGNTAVVFGKLTTTDPSDPPVMRFAMFYVRRSGEWKMVAAQLVPVTDKNEPSGQ